LVIGRCRWHRPRRAIRGFSDLRDSIETSTDTLTLIEDIAMTSVVLALALSGMGYGHHDAYASGQAPYKVLPTAQAPTKCPPVPTKCPPVPTKCPPAPTKCCPPAPTKCPPAPTKCCPPAPPKVQPCPQAPCKASPQYGH